MPQLSTPLLPLDTDPPHWLAFTLAFLRLLPSVRTWTTSLNGVQVIFLNAVLLEPYFFFLSQTIIFTWLVFFEDSVLWPLDSINILGINVTFDLSQKLHTTEWAKSATRGLETLIRFRMYLIRALLNLWRVLLRLCMEYCSHIYGFFFFTFHLYSSDISSSLCHTSALSPFSPPQGCLFLSLLQILISSLLSRVGCFFAFISGRVTQHPTDIAWELAPRGWT